MNCSGLYFSKLGWNAPWVFNEFEAYALSWPEAAVVAKLEGARAAPAV